MLITSSWTIDILLLFVIITILVYKYFTRKFDYWKKKGIFYIKPVPLIGNAWKVLTFQQNIGQWLKEVYDSIDRPFFGIFISDEPFLVLKSPELIKNVLVKDSNHFRDRRALSPDHNQLIANMLFFQKSPDWKLIRPKMTPAFSTGKLKAMFSIINNVGIEMNKYIKICSDQQDAKEICAKYSTDVIAKCAFAIDANSFTDNDAEFRKLGRLFFSNSWRNWISQTSYIFLHKWAKLFKLDFFDKTTCMHLCNIFWEAIKKREESNIKGNDLIDLTLEIMRNKELRNAINFEGDRVVSQAMQFFAAGFESVSSTISFTLYEICIQPQLQDKLRNEIVRNIQEHNGITYEALKDMEYLTLCIMETLRKYPVISFLERNCNEDYQIPGTDIIIEKGIAVFMPMMGLHYDEKYFPEPNKYNPERFNQGIDYNKDGLCFLPFGGGPRICLGGRFGLLATKIGIVHILSEFVVEPSRDTPIPLQLDPKCFLLQSTVGLPMIFKPIAIQSE